MSDLKRGNQVALSNHVRWHPAPEDQVLKDQALKDQVLKDQILKDSVLKDWAVKYAARLLGKDEDKTLSASRAQPAGTLARSLLRCTRLAKGRYRILLGLASRSAELASLVLLSLEVAHYQTAVKWEHAKQLFWPCVKGWLPELVHPILKRWDETIDSDMMHLMHCLLKHWDELMPSIKPLVLQPASYCNWLRIVEPFDVDLVSPCLTGEKLYVLVKCMAAVDSEFKDRKAQFVKTKLHFGDGVTRCMYADTLWTAAQRDHYLRGFFVPPCSESSEAFSPHDWGQVVDAIVDCPDVCALLRNAQIGLSGYPFFQNWTSGKPLPECWLALMKRISKPHWVSAPLALRLQVLQRAVYQMDCCEAVRRHPSRSCNTSVDKSRFSEPYQPYEKRLYLALHCVNDCKASPLTVDFPEGSTTLLMGPSDEWLSLVLRELLKPTLYWEEWESLAKIERRDGRVTVVWNK